MTDIGTLRDFNEDLMREVQDLRRMLAEARFDLRNAEVRAEGYWQRMREMSQVVGWYISEHGLPNTDVPEEIRVFVVRWLGQHRELTERYGD